MESNGGRALNSLGGVKAYRKMCIRDRLTEMKQRFMPPEVTQYYLEVRKSNTAAQRLYEKLGFVSAGVRKNFYEKPSEDAVLMQMIVPKQDTCQ